MFVSAYGSRNEQRETKGQIWEELKECPEGFGSDMDSRGLLEDSSTKVGEVPIWNIVGVRGG